MKKFAINYEMLSTRTAIVTANSIEEALKNFDNDYNVIVDYSNDSYIKKVNENNVTEFELEKWLYLTQAYWY